MDQNTPAPDQFLSADHASSTNIEQAWDQDNQQWWDWYMSLAENEAGQEEAPLIELPPSKDYAFPDETELVEELNAPYAIKQSQIDSFQRDGFVKLKELMTPGALAQLREEMSQLLKQAASRLGSRFGSLEMMWPDNPIVRQFVFSSRLARLASELLGVPKVRLYHDNGLSKQPTTDLQETGRKPCYDETNTVCHSKPPYRRDGIVARERSGRWLRFHF